MESELKGFVFNHGLSPSFANHKKFDLFGSQKGTQIRKCFPTAKAKLKLPSTKTDAAKHKGSSRPANTEIAANVTAVVSCQITGKRK